MLNYTDIFLISDFRRDLSIVYFLLCIYPASNCSWPTFRNPVSVPYSKAGCTVYTVHPAFEDGTDTGFRNVGQLQFDAGEIPKRKYTISKSRQKSGIKNEHVSYDLYYRHLKQHI